MARPRSSPDRREWNDLAVIVVGLTLFGLAIWGGPVLSGAGEDIAYVGVIWLVYAGAGALSIAGVLASQRPSTQRLGRMLVIAAAVALLAGLFAFRELGLRAWFTTIMPALILLLASRNLGPLPPAS